MEAPLQAEPESANAEANAQNRPSFPISTRVYLLLLATIVALSVAYYFAIALPATGRARLDFEKQKYAAEQKEKESLAEKNNQEHELNASLLQSCLDGAEDAYWTYVKLNGKAIPNKPGTYTAPLYVWDNAAKQKKDAIGECQLRYGK